MEELVSIGIATRNRVSFLKDAVESALTQQCDRPYEVVLVDDASTDKNVKTYLDSLKNPKLRIIYRQYQGGEAATRNTIIQNMKGSYVLWLDDDDCLQKHGLASQLDALGAHPEADVIYANLLQTDASLAPVREYTYKDIPRHLQLHVMLFYCPFPNVGTLIRKSLFERCGLYDESFVVAPDYDFWVRAALMGASFVHNNRVIYFYRAHGNNAALDNENDVFCEMNVRIVQKLLSSVPLETLFPIYDWAKNREQSFGLAMSSLAAVFARYRHFDYALDVIRQGEEKSRSFELRAMKALILKWAERQDEAWSVLEDAVIASNQPLFNILRMAGLR
ncbi:MAG: glycosyltransferase [SAR324 cluster bacterium]|uniref:Glycosyltransferase n=1 Tax=SAR324 cluster bacterium TaxID=2024889 RepID=A0A7X9ILA3_9DELT|nr:glycosyltransferase [SAR324 cluster bacterium]